MTVGSPAGTPGEALTAVGPLRVGPPPAYDPQLTDAMAVFKTAMERVPLLPDTIEANREAVSAVTPTALTAFVDFPEVRTHERQAAGPDGPVDLTVVEPVAPSPGPRPGILVLHGGGLVLGDRWFAAAEAAIHARNRLAVAVLVEYRLAPEHPGSAPVEDCYAALLWLAEHAEEFDVDPQRLVVSGFSAGGGLSAGVALLARDRSGPVLAGQFLGCPMLDDRDRTVSTHQFDGIGIWDREHNVTAWDAVLGPRPHHQVPEHVAPSRAQNLSGLPPAYIDVGSAEVFRDEAVDYAMRLWASGTAAELHVWDGGFHGFASSAPLSHAGSSSLRTAASWWRRILTPRPPV